MPFKNGLEKFQGTILDKEKLKTIIEKQKIKIKNLLVVFFGAVNNVQMTHNNLQMSAQDLQF